MPLPVYSAEQYLSQFQRLLPRGRVWHRDLGLIQDAYLLTLMPTWARLHLQLNNLIAEIFPCTTNELLPEWEESLGLPDPCTGPLATLQERVAAVCAKFVARGGQSKTYYIGIAAQLGFTITIIEFAQFRCGINRCGDAVYGPDWVHTWRIDVSNINLIYFRAHLSHANNALRNWGNKLLECVMDAIKPAHTILEFGYIGEAATTGPFMLDQSPIGGPDVLA